MPPAGLTYRAQKRSSRSCKDAIKFAVSALCLTFAVASGDAGKLPTDADAMLHLIVADLVAGADIMQGKAAGDPADGAHKVVTAANAYGRYFNDAGWKPLG